VREDDELGTVIAAFLDDAVLEPISRADTPPLSVERGRVLRAPRAPVQ
jgi:hypothetical protein